MLPKPLRRRFLESLTTDELAFLDTDWRFWARDEQLAPPGAWRAWVFLGGRGAGKTRAGAQWVAECVAHGAAGRIALIAATYAEARDVMVEGASGLLAIARADQRPRFEPSRRRLLWPNGAQAALLSAEEPDALRGPQFDAAWADEFAKWPRGTDSWAMLQLALRLGPAPRAMVTTTPRNVAHLRDLLADPGTVVTHAASAANRANLAPGFIESLQARHAGTRLARQELEGELLEDLPGALWTHALLDQARGSAPDTLVRIVVAVDPPVSAGETASECGIIAAGRDDEGGYWILADRSVHGWTPQAWAARVVETATMVGADRVVAEVNQGGELVAAVLREVAPDLPVRMVRATRAKAVRAEPVAALYEQGRVRHARVFPELEDQMTSFVAGPRRGPSPDRVDALVWALTDLMAGALRPRIRGI